MKTYLNTAEFRAKRRKQQRAYRATEAGRQAHRDGQKRYDQSPKGKATQQRYRKRVTTLMGKYREEYDAMKASMLAETQS